MKSDYWDRLKDIPVPSTATFVETLCFDPTINRDVQRKVVKDLQRMALDTFHEEAILDFEEDIEDMSDFGDKD